MRPHQILANWWTLGWQLMWKQGTGLGSLKLRWGGTIDTQPLLGLMAQRFGEGLLGTCYRMHPSAFFVCYTCTFLCTGMTESTYLGFQKKTKKKPIWQEMQLDRKAMSVMPMFAAHENINIILQTSLVSWRTDHMHNSLIFAQKP